MLLKGFEAQNHPLDFGFSLFVFFQQAASFLKPPVAVSFNGCLFAVKIVTKRNQLVDLEFQGINVHCQASCSGKGAYYRTLIYDWSNLIFAL